MPVLNSLTPFFARAELVGLESLRFEDEFSVAKLGDTLAEILEIPNMQSEPTPVRLEDSKLATPGDLISIITMKKMKKLKGFNDSVEDTRTSGYALNKTDL